jgi:hypothetical protein
MKIALPTWSSTGASLALVFTVAACRGQELTTLIVGERLGVLLSKTKRHRDLVSDRNTVTRWNGRHYD